MGICDMMIEYTKSHIYRGRARLLLGEILVLGPLPLEDVRQGLVARQLARMRVVLPPALRTRLLAEQRLQGVGERGGVALYSCPNHSINPLVHRNFADTLELPRAWGKLISSIGWFRGRVPSAVPVHRGPDCKRRATCLQGTTHLRVDVSIWKRRRFASALHGLEHHSHQHCQHRLTAELPVTGPRCPWPLWSNVAHLRCATCPDTAPHLGGHP